VSQRLVHGLEGYQPVRGGTVALISPSGGKVVFERELIISGQRPSCPTWASVAMSSGYAALADTGLRVSSDQRKSYQRGRRLVSHTLAGRWQAGPRTSGSHRGCPDF